MNVGEEIVVAYLTAIKGCEFTQLNLHNPDIQGEIDVLGIDFRNKRLFVCEVAVHLTSGLRYVKGGRPHTGPKLLDKFRKDIGYARKHFLDFEVHFMLWSPLVKNSRETSKENQLKVVENVRDQLKKEFQVEIDLVINERFAACLLELRSYVRGQKKEMKSPVLRYLQIEETLNRLQGRK